jgi:hypothetical protein
MGRFDPRQTVAITHRCRISFKQRALARPEIHVHLQNPPLDKRVISLPQEGTPADANARSRLTTVLRDLCWAPLARLSLSGVRPVLEALRLGPIGARQALLFLQKNSKNADTLSRFTCSNWAILAKDFSSLESQKTISRDIWHDSQ